MCSSLLLILLACIVLCSLSHDCAALSREPLSRRLRTSLYGGVIQTSVQGAHQSSSPFPASGTNGTTRVYIPMTLQLRPVEPGDVRAARDDWSTHHPGRGREDFPVHRFGNRMRYKMNEATGSETSGSKEGGGGNLHFRSSDHLRKAVFGQENSDGEHGDQPKVRETIRPVTDSDINLNTRNSLRQLNEEREESSADIPFSLPDTFSETGRHEKSHVKLSDLEGLRNYLKKANCTYLGTEDNLNCVSVRIRHVTDEVGTVVWGSGYSMSSIVVILPPYVPPQGLPANFNKLSNRSLSDEIETSENLETIKQTDGKMSQLAVARKVIDSLVQPVKKGIVDAFPGDRISILLTTTSAVNSNKEKDLLPSETKMHDVPLTLLGNESIGDAKIHLARELFKPHHSRRQKSPLLTDLINKTHPWISSFPRAGQNQTLMRKSQRNSTKFSNLIWFEKNNDLFCPKSRKVNNVSSNDFYVHPFLSASSKSTSDSSISVSEQNFRKRPVQNDIRNRRAFYSKDLKRKLRLRSSMCISSYLSNGGNMSNKFSRSGVVELFQQHLFSDARLTCHDDSRSDLGLNSSPMIETVPLLVTSPTALHTLSVASPEPKLSLIYKLNVYEKSFAKRAFIQIDKELKYLVDGVTVHMSDMFKGSSGGALPQGGAEARFGGVGGGDLLAEDRLDSHHPPPPHKNYIQFDPPQLDFKEHPVGMPVMRKVVVRNVGPGAGGATADSAAVQLHSLSGNTLHFHCTFFQDKVVSAYSNTTFDVVFLGREEGVIENTIFIHTSIGTYKYAVRAVGTTNPYRLRPLVGVRMPLNSSYTPLIRLHNPHPYTLQVREMYSSGGDLHLELLGGAVEGDASHWSIPPYHTRPLARATFVARRENNHTAYIRIVTAGGEGAYLVVPVEVEVSGEPGLYSPHDGLHFPLLTPHHAPATLPLMLLNSAHKHIHIQNVITTPVNDAITVDFKPVKIPPGSVKPTQVATVTVDPSKMRQGGALHGKLLVKSKVSAYKLSVPFSVNLLYGHLRYNPAVTTFYTGPPHLDPANNPSAGGNRRSSDNTSSPTTNFSHFSFPSFPSLSSSSSSSSLSSSLSWSSSLSSSSTVSLLEPTSSPDGEDGDLFSSGGAAVGAAEPSSGGGAPLLYRPGEPRNLSLTNTFLCPVVVYNVTLPPHARKHFKVVWRGEVVLPEGGEGTVASIQLLSVGSQLRLRAHLTVHTNITSVTIPVTAYNGRLTKHLSSTGVIDWDHPGLRSLRNYDQSLLPVDSDKDSSHSSSSDDDDDDDDISHEDEDGPGSFVGRGTGVGGRRVRVGGGLPETVDLGTVGMAEQRDLHFYVMNENPVSLRLESWSANASWCEVELLSVGVRGGGDQRRAQDEHLLNALWVGPGEVALFRVSVLTPGVEGVFWGSAAVHTPFEALKLDFKLRTAVGQLTMIPTPIVFEESYPGKVSSVPLEVLSTFGHSMKVQDVLPHLPSDPEFWYRGAPDGEAFTLAPDMRTNIGHLLYDPRQHCSATCYAGFALADKLGQQWSNSLALAGHVADTDAALLSGLRQRYTNLSAPTFNTSLVLHTSHLHAFPFTVQVSLVWPRVVTPRELVFPLTQLRNTSVASLPLVNPTTESLYVQVLFLHQHPSPHLLAEALTHQLEFSDLRTDGSDSELFRLVDLDSSSSGASGGTTDSCGSGSSSSCLADGGVSADPTVTSGVAQHRKQVEADLATRVAKETMVFRLGPGDQVDVRVSFRPVAAGAAQSVLLVRNNLTVVDAVLLRGAGGQGAIKFGNRKPDAATATATPLTFSLAAKHLKDCDASHRSGTASREPKLTVKRTFTARNTGDLPVTVNGFLVAGVPCEAYGFKVIHCDPFTLEPNATRKIDIAFSPDFTLSKVQQSLQLLSPSAVDQQLVYTLQATVPASLLAACAAALPRPHWEPLLYYTVITLLAVMLAATLLIAMMDADILVKENVTYMTANQPPQHLDKDKLFDLKALGTLKDVNKKASVTVNNGACLNGHISNSHQDYGHPRNQASPNTKVGYSNTNAVNSQTNSNHNSNNNITKRGSSHSIAANYSSSNNNTSNSIPNGKCKSIKSVEYRSESVNSCGEYSSMESKAKDSRSKCNSGPSASEESVGVNEQQRTSHFITGIRSYVKRFVQTVHGLMSGGSTASSSSVSQSRRRGSGAVTSRASPSLSGNGSSSSITNNKYQQLPSATVGSASDSRSSSSNNNHHHNNNNNSNSKYSKNLRNDAEYKGKEKSSSSCGRRASKERSFCDSSAPSAALGAGGYSSPCYKASQKGREVEEETSSCTTESSNTEDLSISDKDSSSKSESTSSSRGAGNKAGNTGKSNNKSTTKSGITNNHHKKIQKARSQPSLPSNSSSSNNNHISSSNSSNNNSSSPSPTTTALESSTAAGNSLQCLQAKDARVSSDGFGGSNKDNDEGDFKITVRGKGIKKGKACSVPVMDISADHCLELPYSPKILKPPTLPSESLLRRIKNRTTRVQSESSVSSVLTSGIATGRPISVVVAECRAAVVTHNVVNYNNSLNPNPVIQPPPRPTPSTDLQPPNPRDSYSAKVLGHDKLKAKVTPVGKIMPEPKRVQPQRTLGAIGQKIPPSIPPFSQHSHLSLFSQELPSHSPLQQFYGNAAPQSFHSWDPRIVSPSMVSAQPAGLAPPGLSAPVGGLDGWACKPALPQQQPASSLGCKVPGMDNVWSTEMFRQPAGSSTLPARAPLNAPSLPWDTSSIWSSNNTWRGAGAADLWPPSPNTAVVQGLGFDPVGVWRPSAAPSDSSIDASGWPSSPQAPLLGQPGGGIQHSSPRKAKNI